MKKHGLFDKQMTKFFNDVKYNILCNGRKMYSDLEEEEYFNVMEDLAIQYYQTGSPRPEDLETEIIKINIETIK